MECISGIELGQMYLFYPIAQFSKKQPGIKTLLRSVPPALERDDDVESVTSNGSVKRKRNNSGSRNPKKQRTSNKSVEFLMTSPVTETTRRQLKQNDLRRKLDKSPRHNIARQNLKVTVHADSDDDNYEGEEEENEVFYEDDYYEEEEYEEEQDAEEQEDDLDAELEDIENDASVQFHED